MTHGRRGFLSSRVLIGQIYTSIVLLYCEFVVGYTIEQTPSDDALKIFLSLGVPKFYFPRLCGEYSQRDTSLVLCCPPLSIAFIFFPFPFACYDSFPEKAFFLRVVN